MTGTEVRSPLNGSTHVTLLFTRRTADVIAAWKQSVFGLDVSDELSGIEELVLYRCEESGLEFFHPEQATGSPRLYSRLCRFPWYYQDGKWEHEAAIDELDGSERVLEMGCGRGAFLRRLREEKGILAEGIETNPDAIEAAHAAGLVVSSPEQLSAARREGTFDAVCAFQVLEHVPDPKGFLSAMLRYLRPGGKLLVAVPNRDSFIRLEPDRILDAPPHHMTRWNDETLRSLTRFFPMRLIRIRKEPLDGYDVEPFAKGLVKRLPVLGRSSRISSRLGRSLTALLRNQSGIRRRLIGQNIYAAYEHIG
jgi:SAM-dependent methyltransferase